VTSHHYLFHCATPVALPTKSSTLQSFAPRCVLTTKPKQRQAGGGQLIFFASYVAFAVLGVCIAVGSVLWLTWRWSLSLPIGIAAGVRALVIALFFAPGLLGGMDPTGAFLLPCPAVVSIAFMIAHPGGNGNAGWFFGVLPLVVAWALLWLMLYARYRYRRTADVDTKKMTVSQE
jgi:hypothetical protein